MSLKRLKSLLSDFTPYQDVVIKEEIIIAKGMRECEKRWEIIKPHIKHDSVIVDVGSDLGYFTTKIAEEFPDSLVISLEQAEKSSEIQKEILGIKKLTNVVLCQHKMDLRTLRGLSITVEAIDTFLILNVLHHYPLEESRKWLLYLSMISPELIIELPQVSGGNKNSTGGDQYNDFDKELKNFYEHVDIIEVSSLGDEQDRVIYKAWNESVFRDKLCPTFVFDLIPEVMKTVHKLEFSDNKWIFNDGVRGEFITGINAWTLLYLNPIYPESKWFQIEAVVAYYSLLRDGIGLADVRPFNLLVTPKGMKAIDYDEVVPEIDRSMLDIESTRRVFVNMDRFIDAFEDEFLRKPQGIPPVLESLCD